MKDSAANPALWRRLENGHILLWLLKDTCWVLEFKTGGVLMIAPTMGMAFLLLWKLRHSRAEAFHNGAVCFWIAANSVWMLGEFFDWPLRPVAAGLFLAGLGLLLFYYLVFFCKEEWLKPTAASETPPSAP